MFHPRRRETGSPEPKRNLLAALIANATNLVLVRMAEVCGISYDTLAWTQERYVREETLAAANAALVRCSPRTRSKPTRARAPETRGLRSCANNPVTQAPSYDPAFRRS
ncbi:Tn3 family transposase [Streptomyces sp. NPDC000405]|uniref:Tn3 family transposase n=1 Tax=Streptomyces sp. NPDC000405 TaxID=3161033 RepID=UPI00398D28BF